MSIKHWALAVLFSLGSIASNAAMQVEKITYNDDDTKLTGYFYWEDSFNGKRPGVMVVHEWWGLNDYAKLRAEMLAKLGYVAFAADMYGNNKVTRHANDAKGWMKQITENTDSWQKRALSGLKQLKAHPKVNSAKTAAIGYCFGGATIMQMAYAGADLLGVASFHGSLPVASEDQFSKIKARILIAHGDSDGFVPAEQIQSFKSALTKANADWEMDLYGGAMHSFTNPYSDGYGMKGLQYNENADRRSWSRLLSFFEEIFEDEL